MESNYYICNNNQIVQMLSFDSYDQYKLHHGITDRLTLQKEKKVKVIKFLQENKLKKIPRSIYIGEGKRNATRVNINKWFYNELQYLGLTTKKTKYTEVPVLKNTSKPSKIDEIISILKSHVRTTFPRGVGSVEHSIDSSSINNIAKEIDKLN